MPQVEAPHCWQTRLHSGELDRSYPAPYPATSSWSWYKMQGELRMEHLTPY